MLVREIMTTNVECIAPDTTIRDAAQKMKSLDVGFLPVCDKDRLTGTLTDRDIVLRAIADGRDLSSSIENIFSKDVFYCFDDEDVETCAENMRENEVKRMLILDRNKRLAGVVSIGDLSKVEQQAAGDTLKDISEAA